MLAMEANSVESAAGVTTALLDEQTWYATIRRGLNSLREERGLSIRDVARKVAQISPASTATIARLFVESNGQPPEVGNGKPGVEEKIRPGRPNPYLMRLVLYVLATTLEEVEARGLPQSKSPSPAKETAPKDSFEDFLRKKFPGAMMFDRVVIREVESLKDVFMGQVMCRGLPRWFEAALKVGFTGEEIGKDWTRGDIAKLPSRAGRSEFLRAKTLLLAMATNGGFLSRTAAMTNRLGTFSDAEKLEVALEGLDEVLRLRGASAAALSFRTGRASVLDSQKIEVTKIPGIGPVTVSWYLYFRSFDKVFANRPWDLRTNPRPVPMGQPTIWMLQAGKFINSANLVHGFMDYGDYLTAIGLQARDIDMLKDTDKVELALFNLGIKMNEEWKSDEGGPRTPE